MSLQRAPGAARQAGLAEDAQRRYMLRTRGLSKEFNGFLAVSGLDLTIERNSVHALIGPNGAGKTTVFNLLTKFIAPTSGVIEFDGEDITAMSPAQVARLGLVRSFQISAIFPSMTVLGNLHTALQRKRGIADQFWLSSKVLRRLDDEAMSLVERVGLAEYARVRAGELPYGRKRALELATTIALDPSMLLLDEPMAGMGREDIQVISELIRETARHRTVLLVEHNLSVVETLSDHVTVLQRGEILSQGTYEQVSTDPLVKEAYIGRGDHG